MVSISTTFSSKIQLNGGRSPVWIYCTVDPSELISRAMKIFKENYNIPGEVDKENLNWNVQPQCISFYFMQNGRKQKYQRKGISGV